MQGHIEDMETGDTEMEHRNLTCTKETTPFHLFKDIVVTQAGLAVADLDVERLTRAYDMGESAWAVAETQKLFAQARKARPFSFANNMKACVRRVKVA